MTDTTRTREPDIWDADPQVQRESRPQGDALFAVLNRVLRYRRWIVAGALAFFVITVVGKLRTPRTYTSTSRFVTEGGSSRVSELSGLAAQFGVQLGGDRNSYTPQFYIDLVQSPTILRPTVEHPFTFATDSGPRTATLIQIYGTQAENRASTRELAVRALAADLHPELSVKTNVVQLGVTAPNPDLAAQVNRHLLELLDRFNLETRRSRATNERSFIEARLKIVAAELRAAEDNAGEFLRRNRQYDRSPELKFDFERLSTNVTLARQVYNSLAQSLEQAKVDEIRNSPVLTVVQPPEPAVWPDARGTLRAGVLALIIGGILGLGAGFLREQWRQRVEAGSEESRQFRRLLQEMLLDIRTLITLGIWRRPRSA